jgi:hypothetical protein
VVPQFAVGMQLPETLPTADRGRGIDLYVKEVKIHFPGLTIIIS